MEDTFKDVEIGQKLYSIKYGYGYVVNRSFGYIAVQFEDGESKNTYFPNGKYGNYDQVPELYWDKPEIIAPPKPKRIVVVEVIKYVNVYYNQNTSKYELASVTHDRMKDAVNAKQCGRNRNYLGACELKGTYQIEE